MQSLSYRLGRYDRMTMIGGASFRPVSKTGRQHLLQVVTGTGILEDHFKLLSDEDIGSLLPAEAADRQGLLLARPASAQGTGR